jgi:hypothetical protein
MIFSHARIAVFLLSLALPSVLWGCRVLRELARGWDR